MYGVLRVVVAPASLDFSFAADRDEPEIQSRCPCHPCPSICICLWCTSVPDIDKVACAICVGEEDVLAVGIWGLFTSTEYPYWTSRETTRANAKMGAKIMVV